MVNNFTKKVAVINELGFVINVCVFDSDAILKDNEIDLTNHTEIKVGELTVVDSNGEEKTVDLTSSPTIGWVWSNNQFLYPGNSDGTPG